MMLKAHCAQSLICQLHRHSRGIRWHDAAQKEWQKISSCGYAMRFNTVSSLSKSWWVWRDTLISYVEMALCAQAHNSRASTPSISHPACGFKWETRTFDFTSLFADFMQEPCFAPCRCWGVVVQSFCQRKLCSEFPKAGPETMLAMSRMNYQTSEAAQLILETSDWQKSAELRPRAKHDLARWPGLFGIPLSLTRALCRFGHIYIYSCRIKNWSKIWAFLLKTGPRVVVLKTGPSFVFSFSPSL